MPRARQRKVVPFRLPLESLFIAMFAYRRNQIQEGALPTEGANDSYGAAILGVCWLVEILSTIFIGLRLYCKMKRSKHLWWDDYVLLAAWVRCAEVQQQFPGANMPTTIVIPICRHGHHHCQRISWGWAACIQRGPQIPSDNRSVGQHLRHLFYHRSVPEQDIVRHNPASSDARLSLRLCMVRHHNHGHRDGAERSVHLDPVRPTRQELAPRTAGHLLGSIIHGEVRNVLWRYADSPLIASVRSS
jgi:hypothetical protein